MMGWYGAAGAMHVAGGVLMLLFWVVVVVLAVWAVRAVFPAGRSEAERPIEILRRRYAAGELTQAEFEHARRTIE
jgi:putative membrane protein